METLSCAALHFGFSTPPPSFPMHGSEDDLPAPLSCPTWPETRLHLAQLAWAPSKVSKRRLPKRPCETLKLGNILRKLRTTGNIQRKTFPRSTPPQCFTSNGFGTRELEKGQR
ncbi:hypothetical protein JOB18_021839 [Solea senegalensis]|uniref:Uncharacterized protein n=1 Tax=Solea senegalensis TaxID=28829 RepID=A0AAV6SAM1_SOLSE|nr:hypothetical protein JOB18_021839 [Solea senegalensis]